MTAIISFIGFLGILLAAITLVGGIAWLISLGENT